MRWDSDPKSSGPSTAQTWRVGYMERVLGNKQIGKTVPIGDNVVSIEAVRMMPDSGWVAALGIIKSGAASMLGKHSLPLSSPQP